MSIVFDEEKWRGVIKKPDWYIEFYNFRQNAVQDNSLSLKEKRNLRAQIYQFFKENYLAGNINIGETGPDWDSERTEVDTVVIHHTSGQPGMSWQDISVIHLLNVYVPYYANPYKGEEFVKGTPIYSGHFRDNMQVFYGYHHVVRNDGGIERLLDDEEIGWHAGNWDVNKRSIAIVFDDDLEEKTPTAESLQSVAEIIRENYAYVSPERIFGHREVKKTGSTTCPGNLFLPTTKSGGWKRDLLDLVS